MIANELLAEHPWPWKHHIWHGEKSVFCELKDATGREILTERPLVAMTVFWLIEKAVHEGVAAQGYPAPESVVEVEEEEVVSQAEAVSR